MGGGIEHRKTMTLLPLNIELVKKTNNTVTARLSFMDSGGTTYCTIETCATDTEQANNALIGTKEFIETLAMERVRNLFNGTDKPTPSEVAEYLKREGHTGDDITRFVEKYFYAVGREIFFRLTGIDLTHLEEDIVDLRRYINY